MNEKHTTNFEIVQCSNLKIIVYIDFFIFIILQK